ncbi:MULTISPECIES: LytR/AlgR family response regulator transcription factor [Roseateles]|uniref:LytTR family DNA-binding domain-containing protein n=1 Tax=Pelomonas caseinilytica TaxID=2906763 RepID=A0ABS8XKB6_9BURK|nr:MULTISPECIES: LytTR family DNA-binding domain-containing protein [unclassified Roseateles]MCE4539367.1 LytTR family DNA-binding domain-containing protein [Pelomonas sp. P7]HEV6965850.1 LytTR family DNA-binding domain-containing protein [Roseateles sp.]
MTTALIADDEPHLAQYLKAQLAQAWPDLQVVKVAANGVEAAQAIAELEPDVAFLDIQMPGLTGLEVAQGIEGGTRVVFVTAYDQYAIEAFEARAVDYLLKPLKAERLASCVARLRAEPAAASEGALAETLKRLLPQGAAPARLRYIRAAQGELMHQIPVDEVLFFHADDKYTVVQTATAEHLIRTPIFELAGQLDPERFWQVHRSTIINLDHLAGTRRDEQSRLFVRIRGPQGVLSRELPVSRAYVHLFKAM